MKISLSADLAERLEHRARAAGITIDDYVECVLRADEEAAWGGGQPDDPEFIHLQSAIDEAVVEAERGEGRPAAEVLDELRAKHGLSR